MRAENIRVELPGSKAAVCVNYAGGCYIEFQVKGDARSVAHVIEAEDLLPLIEVLKVAARRSSMQIEE